MKISQFPIFQFLIRYVKTYRVKSSLIALAVLVLGGMAAQTILQRGGVESAIERTPKVVVFNVNEYRIENAIIESVGEVESLSQVELKSQVSERVKEIRVSIGQRVSRGQVLLVLDDALLTSQVVQAQASLESAKVALNRIKLEQQQQLRGDTLNKNYEDGLATLGNLYDEFDVTLEALDDIFFGSDLSDGGETNIQYYANTNNDVTLALRLQRLYRETEGLRKQGVTDYQVAERGSGTARFKAIQSGHTLTVKTAETIKTGRDAVRDFKDTILGNNTVHIRQSIIDGHVADLASYDSSINGYLNSLLGTINTINNQLDEEERYPIDVQSQELVVKQREAALQNLLAQRDRVFIPSPISGVVANIPVRVGELVNIGETVASIVNPGTLQVKTYLNGRDIQFVTQGTRALVENTFEGFVTNIAPSLDSKTKKVETIVALAAVGSSELVIGDFANVQIFIEGGLQKDDTFFLPLQSVRVTSEAAFVYTVNDENEIVQHQVQLGRVIGDSIEVLNGIDEAMNIVFSARGLEPGDNVELQE